MDGWDIVMGIVNLVPRLPLEKILERDPSKDFEQFAQSLEKKGLLTEAPAIGSESSPKIRHNIGGPQPNAAKIISRA